MNNKQIEIILNSLQPVELHGYILETFYEPIKIIKDNIARGLKSMKLPIADEDLLKIKTTFMRYEMVVDRNLNSEEILLNELIQKQMIHNQFEVVIESQQKEMELANVLLEILDHSEATCQIYDLLRQLIYKTEDRIDITKHYLNKNE